MLGEGCPHRRLAVWSRRTWWRPWGERVVTRCQECGAQRTPPVQADGAVVVGHVRGHGSAGYFISNGFIVPEVVIADA